MYRLSCDTQLPMTMMTHSLLVTGSSCAPLPPPAPFCPQPGGSCLLLAAKEKQVDSAVSPQCRRVKLHLLFPSFLKNKHQEKKKKKRRNKLAGGHGACYFKAWNKHGEETSLAKEIWSLEQGGSSL